MKYIRTICLVGVSLGIFGLLMSGMAWDPLMAGIVAVGTYIGLSLLTTPQKKIGNVSVSRIRGGEEMRQLLDDADEDFQTLVRSGKQIKDSSVRNEVTKLQNTAEQIIRYLEKKLERIPAARRFFTYYLDVAGKLASRYVELQNTGLQTEEVKKVMRRTAESLPELNKTFAEQYTHLMEGELMDTDVELDVLKQMREMEGGSSL